MAGCRDVSCLFATQKARYLYLAVTVCIIHRNFIKSSLQGRFYPTKAKEPKCISVVYDRSYKYRSVVLVYILTSVRIPHHLELTLFNIFAHQKYTNLGFFLPLLVFLCKYINIVLLNPGPGFCFLSILAGIHTHFWIRKNAFVNKHTHLRCKNKLRLISITYTPK